MQNFYSIFQYVGVIVLAVLLWFAMKALRPIDYDDDKKAHSKF